MWVVFPLGERRDYVNHVSPRRTSGDVHRVSPRRASGLCKPRDAGFIPSLALGAVHALGPWRSGRLTRLIPSLSARGYEVVTVIPSLTLGAMRRFGECGAGPRGWQHNAGSANMFFFKMKRRNLECWLKRLYNQETKEYRNS